MARKKRGTSQVLDGVPSHRVEPLRVRDFVFEAERFSAVEHGVILGEEKGGRGSGGGLVGELKSRKRNLCVRESWLTVFIASWSVGNFEWRS